MDSQLHSLDHARETIIDLMIRFGPRLLAALLILAAGVLVGRWVDGWLRGALKRLNLDPPLQLLLSRLVRALVVLLFLVMALQNLGVELLPLIAGLGVAGAGIALAMQGVLSNVVAGLTIILTKPFRVGEYISVVHEEGTVQNVTLFSTVLTHPDRSRIVIPNRKIVGEILHNYGQIRQLGLNVGVAYDTDMAAAFSVIQAVVAASPRVLKDIPPAIGIACLGESAIRIAVQPWVSVADYGVAGGELNQALVEALRANRIAMPPPQREVRLLGNS